MVRAVATGISLLLVTTAVGCSSPPTTTEVGLDRWRSAGRPEGPVLGAGEELRGSPLPAPDGQPPALPPPRELSGETLERELALTRPGRVLFPVIRAHGGWDLWRAVRGLGYDREPIRGPTEAAPGGEAAPTVRPGPARVELVRPGQAEAWSAVIGGVPDAADAAQETLLVTAPFALVDRGLRAEYLGKWVDLGSGLSFRKIQFSRVGASEPFLCILYCDATTHLVRRILLPEAGGGFRLFVLSEWEEVDPDGADGLAPLRWARRRAVYRLRKRYDRVELERPLRVETLSTVEIEVDRPARDVAAGG